MADEQVTSQLVNGVLALGSREKNSAADELNKSQAIHQRKQARLWRSLQGAERHARSAAGAADAEYRDCSCGGAARDAQSRACKIIPLASGAHRCLTPRSSGAPTAGHQARSGGTRYIFASPGLASCRCRPLSSNVRHHKRSHVPLPTLRQANNLVHTEVALMERKPGRLYRVQEGLHYSHSRCLRGVGNLGCSIYAVWLRSNCRAGRVSARSGRGGGNLILLLASTSGAASRSFSFGTEERQAFLLAHGASLALPQPL